MSTTDSDDSSNNVGEIFGRLQSKNDWLASILKDIREFQVKITELKKSLNDKTTADSVYLYMSFEDINFAERYVTLELVALTKSRQHIEDKMAQLQICLIEEQEILFYSEENAWGLVDEILDIQSSMSVRIQDLNKNGKVEIIRQVLELKKSE